MPNSSALILVVEDDSVTRTTLVKVLQKSGFDVIEAANGREGLTQFMEHHPQLVLMDAMMPELDGYQAITAIRHYEQNRAVPILMFTALNDLNSVDKAFEVGATDFITKPINWNLLSQRVRYSIRTSQIEDDLRRSQAQLTYAQKLAKLGYWEWDAVTDQVTGSDSAFRLFNIPKQDNINMDNFLSNVLPQDLPIFQQALAEAARGQSHIEVNFRVQNPQRQPTHVECLGEVRYNDQGDMLSIVGSVQDITRLHKAESMIDYQANHDNLTELPNRIYFTQELERHFEHTEASHSSVIIFDIDRFKSVNDNLGQQDGDTLLISMAQRLKRVTREGDFIARLGSDEFAIIIRQYQDHKELNLLISRLVQDLKQPFILGQKELFITYSMGIASFPEDGATAEDLMRDANIARGQAKQHGGNQFLFYRAEMNAEAKHQMMLENDLRRALEHGEIEVYYQPQVNAQTLKPIGAEALVRWNHPEVGLVSPTVFVPLAESTGLIVDIGLFVLQSAVKQLESWHASGHDQMRVGVNLSARQFTQSNLIEDVQSVLIHTALDAKYIDLEITESFAMSNAEQNINILKSLKAMGVSISIDDFGTGYSSLSYLHRFPIDTIKIDRSFIFNLSTKEGQAIARTIIAMADGLGLEVVAEGVEDEEQIAFLQQKNCDILQGFKFGKPMPADAFSRYLQSS